MDERTNIKATNAVVELRVSTICEMLIKGFARDKILRYGTEEWNIKERQVESYISKAWEKIRRLTDYDIDNELKLARARYEDLYQKNYNIQDYREARQVQADINKMLGINAPDKQEHSGSVSLPTLQIEIVRPNEGK